MKTKAIIIGTFILINISSFSQNDFGAYAHKQDSLSVKAYEARDDKKFEKLLSEFIVKYDKLKPEDKKENSRYLSRMYYNLTCLYSLQNNKEKAISSFDKALKSGYRDYYHIGEDSDLDNIRNENKFKTVLEPLKQTADYLYIIQRAEKYNTSDSREIPKFTYQNPDNSNLTTLRKAFNLDSIAGTGNDVTKILNLLHWIHNMVPHDGSHENPVVKNALSMIAVCKKENRGLNCRGLATVLNECYLSLGIKSRFITCLPKDSLQIDNDCHVINMVWSTTLKKWLWIDPTFDAYVMNEKGEMLSIEEVRERIIKQQTLIINPDANWNRKNAQTTEHYLRYYMAKNLYKLECSLNSEYDTETREAGKKFTYVDLLPLEYYKQPKGKEEHVAKEGNITFIYYSTNNPAIFWAAP